MASKKCIILRTNTTVISEKINSSLDINNLDLNQINKLFKKKGDGKFERHCDYDMNEYIISIFGWKNGKSGKENKSELPPPEDNELYFGDILIIKSISNNSGTRKIVDLEKNSYKDFLEKAFGGFESLGESDTESETHSQDKYDSDDSFLVNSDEIDEIDNYSSDEEEFKSDEETSEDDDISSQLYDDTESDNDSENSNNNKSVRSDNSSENSSNGM